MAREQLRYPRVGATRDAEILADPPPGFRATERRAAIGSGEARWDFARQEVLRWGISTRIGVDVVSDIAPSGRVQVGDPAELVVPMPLGVLRESVQVVWVVDERRRAGFGYGTLPGHPLIGEQAFIVDWGDDDVVRLTIRAFSRASGRWRLLAPLLPVVRRVVRRRALRALAGPIPGAGGPAAGGPAAGGTGAGR